MVDLTRIREDRFGVSDHESSGSAQGKILKEEFYRTMIHVAGKIPLWCVTPLWEENENFQKLPAIIARLNNDYLNLGDVSMIPRGEFFGASIWQLFKSLKSPFKSVMKMGLLEKYICDETKPHLLCNTIKAGWTPGRCNLKLHDPYLLLLEEILDYYKRTHQEKAESLIKICFFLKLGFMPGAFDQTVLGIRKKIINEQLEKWNWNEEKINALGNLHDWPFERIIKFSDQVNNYLLATYKKLSRSLQGTTEKETMITPQDMTILGRKMFVQFSRQPHKVEKLPLVVHGKALFQHLRLQYTRTAKNKGIFYLKRVARKDRDGGEILRSAERIEEIAIWLVYNGLYSPEITFQFPRNTTFISLQDIVGLLRALQEFFREVSPPASAIPRPLAAR